MKDLLRRYKKRKKELLTLEQSLERLYDRLESVPTVSGKVEKSGDDFPYIREHISVEVSEPAETTRIKLRISISIHTSAREVTGSTPEMCKGSGISIHTSAREVTQHKTKVQNIFSHFNPHFRKGSDGQDIDWTATEDDISIHTSAREVTWTQYNV